VKLSTKGRYAVMAMADLARHAELRPRKASGLTTLSAIADRQEISLPYLEQLFAKLRRAGLVTGVRGPGGGFRLAKPATEMRIADIVMAVDEPIKATRCLSESTSGCLSKGERCLTHDLWEELGVQIEKFLASVTLADVVEQRIKERSQGFLPDRAIPGMHATA